MKQFGSRNARVARGALQVPRLPRSRVAYPAIFAIAAIAVGLSACSSTAQEPLPDPTSDRPLSDEQLVQQTLDQEWAAVASQFPDAIRPDVEIIRFSSPESWGTEIADCLQASGFPSVAATPDGGVEVSGIPDAQKEAFTIARFACVASYPIDPVYSQPLTESELADIYNYFTGELRSCLASLGLEISDPPSLQKFIETYDSDPWLPHSEAMQLAARTNPDLVEVLAQECPQYPDSLW